jgi:PTS system fructose-specific IIC component/PTS system nitrogen regulatory IIA component
MTISSIFRQEGIVPNLKSRTKDEVFRELVGHLSPLCPGVPKETLLSGLVEREGLMTTGIARNIALPHTHVKGLGKTVGLLGVSREGIEYQSLDGEPVHLVFCLVGDDAHPDAHIKVLRSLALLLTNPEFYPSMMKAKGPRDIATTLEQFEALTAKAFS